MKREGRGASILGAKRRREPEHQGPGEHEREGANGRGYLTVRRLKVGSKVLILIKVQKKRTQKSPRPSITRNIFDFSL